MVSATVKRSFDPLQICWEQCVGDPDIAPDEYQRLTARLNRLIAELLDLAPTLHSQAEQTVFILDSLETGPRIGRASITDDEEAADAVALSVRAIDRLNDEQLRFALAHELTHLRLGHPHVAFDRAELEETVGRIWKRSVEALTNDYVVAAGVSIPTGLWLPTPSGEDSLGFNLLGLSVMEVWECMSGRVSRAEMQKLVLGRCGQLIRDTTSPVAEVPTAALAFWRERFGVWQPEWDAEHDLLVEAVRAAESVA